MAASVSYRIRRHPASPRYDDHMRSMLAQCDLSFHVHAAAELVATPPARSLGPEREIATTSRARALRTTGRQSKPLPSMKFALEIARGRSAKRRRSPLQRLRIARIRRPWILGKRGRATWLTSSGSAALSLPRPCWRNLLVHPWIKRVGGCCLRPARSRRKTVRRANCRRRASTAPAGLKHTERAAGLT